MLVYSISSLSVPLMSSPMAFRSSVSIVSNEYSPSPSFNSAAIRPDAGGWQRFQI